MCSKVDGTTQRFPRDHLDYSSRVLYLRPRKKKTTMLIIPVKEGESIDKALKKFKKKFERTQTMRQLRKRQSFTKPSVSRRKEMIRAAYKLGMQTEQE
jgi:small subunit ribosomal protein S21